MATKKKPVVKKTLKKAVSKKVTSHSTPKMKSFRIYKEQKPFTRVGITRQTVYWLVLLIVVVVSQLWILKIQMDIANLTNIITASVSN